MNMRKTLSMVLAVMAPVLLGTLSFAGDKPEAVYGDGANQFSLATGSPGELGLLKVLAEAFGKQDNAKMAWFKAGSGESLNLLKDKKVDLIMVHAPAAPCRTRIGGPRRYWKDARCLDQDEPSVKHAEFEDCVLR